VPRAPRPGARLIGHVAMVQKETIRAFVDEWGVDEQEVRECILAFPPLLECVVDTQLRPVMALLAKERLVKVCMYCMVWHAGGTGTRLIPIRIRISSPWPGPLRDCIKARRFKKINNPPLRSCRL
jgi:hypothetical protein